MIKKLLQTILPIVFAVLLALGFDAWYENLKHNQIIESSLSDVALDISHYAGSGSVYYKLNQINLDSLTNQIEKYEQGKNVEFSFRFARPEINALAWRMARDTGIASDFGRELYKDIARVFNEFDRLEKLWNYNYKFKLERDPNMDQYTLARHFARQLKSIQARQKELTEKSVEFIKKHKDASFMVGIDSE